MEHGNLSSEDGFGLIELVIAIIVLQVALLALIGVFSSAAVAVGRSGQVSSAATLADQQMELYHVMPYDAIGLDVTDSSMPASYSSDATACISGGTYTCSNTPPLNDSNAATWSCLAPASVPNGQSSVITDFSANGVNPCLPHRSLVAPDNHTYAVDTYIRFITENTDERAIKQVTVIVRKGSSNTELATSVAQFDCATGYAAGASSC